MDAADDEEQIINHVTDMQQPEAASCAEAPAAELQNGGGPPPASEASPDASGGAAAGAPAGDGPAAATGLTTPAVKRRRYRSLFGNIGKLITFNRRRQEQPASPGAASEGSSLAESEFQIPTAEAISLDLVVPDADIPSGSAEDPISGQVSVFETIESPEILLVAGETAVESSNPVEEVGEVQAAAEAQVEEEKAEEPAESQDEAKGASVEPEAISEKKKMEYDMSTGGISTILEETEEAVKAQDGGLLSEADLMKLEAEIDLADFDSQRIHEPEVKNAVKFVEAKAKTDSQDLKAEQMDVVKEELDGKAVSRVVVLQNQISESDSGYGFSTSDSPVEAEVEKPEKPQPQVEEVEGSSGGSDVFAKEVEDSLSAKSAMKGDPLISPSDEELASFENAEVCVQDSMVDLEDISVKMDSLIESNSPEKLAQHSEEEDTTTVAVKPGFCRVSESLEDEDDEEMEPVELDLSSNQSVRRRKFMEAKARRQRDLEAARRQQAEAMSGSVPAEESVRSEGPRREAPVRDKDIVDGLGPRRHSHENNACTEGSEGSRSRMRSRLPVKRSASCPRRTVEDYSTYIRSGSGAKKPLSHLIASGYSPVKIDFRPLSRAAQETHGEQLTTGPPQQGTGCDPRPGQAGKRGSKKVHFNSATVDQVATYSAAASDSDGMKQRESDENGQHLSVRARQSGTGVRALRHKTGEADKLAAQHDRSLIKSISVKQTLASRKRLEKLHEDAVKQLGLQDDSQYMTPLQRKDLEVKELKRQLDEAYFVVEQRELELDVFHHGKVKSIEDAVKDRDERIVCLQVQISQLETDFSCLRAQHSEMCTREMNLTESLEQLKVEFVERERRHQDLYLEMYRKGRDSAKFERQDEIEKLAVLEPDKVAMEELLEKLEITQQDLQKWQSIKLKEVYEDSDKAATEADAKLLFLRDSMFHYLTERDREQNKQHLMAMIGIFSFTDVQMKHVMKSLEERRKKGKI